MNKTLLLVALAVILAAPAFAYHDGGVAHCNGCHTMHNSQNGVPMNVPTGGAGQLPVGQGYPNLLLYANKTDVCLDCHDGGGLITFGHPTRRLRPTAPSAVAATSLSSKKPTSTTVTVAPPTRFSANRRVTVSFPESTTRSLIRS